MLPRSSWKGHLRLSLVTIPVQAINAAGGKEANIQLHQLHRTCHSRIQYRKFCPVHGEVDRDEIVYGYEHAKDEYVILEPDAAKRQKESGERTIQIDSFVPLSTLDVSHFAGSTYYLVPDGDLGEKSYAVLLKAMATGQRVGIGLGWFWGRERLVAVRALKGLLCVHMLHHLTELRQPSDIADDIKLPEVRAAELQLAGKLIQASSKNRLDLAAYRDEANEHLREIIDASLEDRGAVSSPAASEGPPTINLMDALKRSISQAGKSTKTRASRAKPKPKAKARRSRRSAG